MTEPMICEICGHEIELDETRQRQAGWTPGAAAGEVRTILAACSNCDTRPGRGNE